MALAIVQQQHSAITSSPANLSVTLTSAPTAGNLLIAFVSDYDNAPIIGAGWTVIDTQVPPNATINELSAYKIAGAGESPTQIPATVGLAGDNGAVHVYEISG
jgi:hypothetical protein